MTEDQWNGSQCSPDPQGMLEFLRTHGMLTDRKARLFGVACCNRLPELQAHPPYKEAIAVAQRAYDDRDFASLPVLADALEDAGCTDVLLLDHLRAASPHVRGCWVLDAVLGQK